MAWWRGSQEGADIYVDLGTANTLVVTRGRGLTVNEPSVIAYRELSSNHKLIVAVGAEAKEKIGRTPGNLIAVHPLKDGVIADLDTTEAMLKHFLARAKSRFGFIKPRVVISLPYGVSDVEKKAVRQAGLAAGAREVVLIDEPMAAAVGAGLPIHEPKGNMVIDIGGGTTEVAVISLYGIVHCEAVRVGGHAFDRAIVNYIRRRHNLVVGDQSAERLKIQIGSAVPGDRETKAQVRGLDFVTGVPRSIEITAAEVHEAIDDHLKVIIDAAHRTLERIPPELITDIVHDGIVIAGGGALIHNLVERFEAELKIPVRIAEEPLATIAKGGEQIIESAELLDRVALDLALI